MIGLVMRGLFGGGDGCLMGIIVALGAICAICGIYQCSKCRMRDCSCIKKFLRAAGTDSFDDFYVTIVVHEVLCTLAKAKMSTDVRLKAGSHEVSTDENNKGVFQQALELFVEQGSEAVDIDVRSDKKILASLRLDPQKDILDIKETVMEKLFTMKQKSKEITNPRIRLTVQVMREGDEESPLHNLCNQGLSDKTELMLRAQFQKIQNDESADADGDGKVTELELLVKACQGPIDKFGSWGSSEPMFLACQGPPSSRKYTLGLYDSEKTFESGKKPQQTVDLLKVLSVQPDPSRSEVFILYHVNPDKVKERFTFRRTDRGRDVWVEMLQMLIKNIREDHEQRKKQRRH